jgi:hypothetical protein
VTLKVVPKATCDSQNCFKKVSYDMNTRENGPMTAKERWNRNSDAALGTFCGISMF